jgi:hypothetical protein
MSILRDFALFIAGAATILFCQMLVEEWSRSRFRSGMGEAYGWPWRKIAAGSDVQPHRFPEMGRERHEKLRHRSQGGRPMFLRTYPLVTPRGKERER